MKGRELIILVLVGISHFGHPCRLHSTPGHHTHNCKCLSMGYYSESLASKFRWTIFSATNEHPDAFNQKSKRTTAPEALELDKSWSLTKGQAIYNYKGLFFYTVIRWSTFPGMHSTMDMTCCFTGLVSFSLWAVELFLYLSAIILMASSTIKRALGKDFKVRQTVQCWVILFPEAGSHGGSKTHVQRTM